MREKYKITAAFVVIVGLVIGWNLQNRQVVEALLGSNTYGVKNTTGGVGTGASAPSLSNDGRYMTFTSSASNLVSSDTNGKQDVFLKDLVGNTTVLVSVDSSGTQGNDTSFEPTISGDGKFIVYTSYATNLVSGDTNNYSDVFRYNITSGATERVSVDSSGTQGNNESLRPDTDTQGRFIVFVSKSTNLAAVTDSNSAYDIILKDMNTGIVKYISQSNAGVVGNATSHQPKISCDGRFVVFFSTAGNLVSPSSGWGDIYLTDLLGTQTVIDIVPSANSWSESPDISCDGNYVSFTSRATNLGAKPSTGSNTYDVYRYSRLAATIQGASTRQDGTAPTGSSVDGVISSDGRYIMFTSSASDMVTPGTDSNSGNDIFLRDMNSTGSRIVTQTASGVTGNNSSSTANFSGTNRITFASNASNLVTGVTDLSDSDVFITDVGTPNTCTF